MLQEVVWLFVSPLPEGQECFEEEKEEDSFFYCPAIGKSMPFVVGKVCVTLHFTCLAVFAKKSSPVLCLPKLRKVGKQQGVFFLQKNLAFLAHAALWLPIAGQ